MCITAQTSTRKPATLGKRHTFGVRHERGISFHVPFWRHQFYDSQLFTGRLRGATLTSSALATTFEEARALSVPGPLRRSVSVAGDVLAGMGLVLCIPFVLLAIGTPIALCVRLLLWMSGLL